MNAIGNLLPRMVKTEEKMRALIRNWKLDRDKESSVASLVQRSKDLRTGGDDERC